MKITKVETENTTEPIALTEAKEWLQVDHDNDDSLISRIIIASREHFERVCGISIVEKKITLDVVNPDFPFLLPYGPVKEIIFLQVDDENSTAPDGYVRDQGRWVKAEYIAGYDTVTHDMKMAILELVKLHYDGRGTAENIPVMLLQKMNMYSRNLFV